MHTPGSTCSSPSRGLITWREKSWPAMSFDVHSPILSTSFHRTRSCADNTRDPCSLTEFFFLLTFCTLSTLPTFIKIQNTIKKKFKKRNVKKGEPGQGTHQHNKKLHKKTDESWRERERERTRLGDSVSLEQICKKEAISNRENQVRRPSGKIKFHPNNMTLIKRRQFEEREPDEEK